MITLKEMIGLPRVPFWDFHGALLKGIFHGLLGDLGGAFWGDFMKISKSSKNHQILIPTEWQAPIYARSEIPDINLCSPFRIDSKRIIFGGFSFFLTIFRQNLEFFSFRINYLALDLT